MDDMPLPRVGYVVKRYPCYSETFIVNEILAHEAAGLDVEIFALRPPKDTHFQDIIAQVRAPVTYISAKRVKAGELWTALEEASRTDPAQWSALEWAWGADVQDLYQGLCLAAQARQHGIEHFHAHFANVATTVTRLASHFTGLPYTFTAHAKDIFHEDVARETLSGKLRDAASVVTVSDFNQDYLRETFDAETDVNRIYNGLDLSRFPHLPPDDRPPRILGIGRLVEKKGFDDLVTACAVLVRQGCQLTCEIIGAGELRAALQDQIERLGLQAHVSLLGPLPQQEVIAKLQASAVLAAPCVVGADGNRDGLPTVLLEAMALGTPCISTDVTGIPEVLHHDQTGLLVPQRDPKALAAAIDCLLSHPARRAHLATQARRLIETDFDVHRSAAQLRSVFQAASHRQPLAVAEVP